MSVFLLESNSEIIYWNFEAITCALFTQELWFLCREMNDWREKSIHQRLPQMWLTLHINTSVYRHHIYCSITLPHSHSVVFELSQTGSHFWEIDLLWNYVRNKLFDLFREPVKNDGHIKRMFKDFCDLKNIRLSHPLSDLSFCRYWGFVVQEETHPKKKKKSIRK